METGTVYGKPILEKMVENYPRGQWPVGRVLEMKVSEDGLVRAVNVKTSSTVITCGELYVMPVGDGVVMMKR